MSSFEALARAMTPAGHASGPSRGPRSRDAPDAKMQAESAMQRVERVGRHKAAKRRGFFFCHPVRRRRALLSSLLLPFQSRSLGPRSRRPTSQHRTAPAPRPLARACRRHAALAPATDGDCSRRPEVGGMASDTASGYYPPAVDSTTRPLPTCALPTRPSAARCPLSAVRLLACFLRPP